MIFININDDFSKKLCELCNFKIIDLSQMETMNKYFDLVDYKACEYSFLTLYMWQHNYNTHIMEKDDTMYIFGKDKKSAFSIVPISIKKRWHRDLKELEKIFNECFNAKIEIRAVPKEYAEFIMHDYPNRFKIISDRDSYDYLYDAESLRTLSGRKMHSKKNHFNKFLNNYGRRFEYKRLTNDEQFSEALELLNKWGNSKDIFDETMEIEQEAIKKVFKNYNVHRDLKIGGIYIDSVLQAFTIADMLTSDTVCVHIEKANSDIDGLYAAINKLFLENEYKDVLYVNREDDLGLEGLRKSKLSYKPLELIEKYTLIEL